MPYWGFQTRMEGGREGGREEGDIPSNFATSKSLLNMPETKAVFLNTLLGVPTSLSFLATWKEESSSSTTPVKATRKPGVEEERDWKASRPERGRERGGGGGEQEELRSRITPVKATRKPGVEEDRNWKASRPNE